MKTNLLIFAGLVLLATGIILNSVTTLSVLPQVLIYAGISFKVLFLLLKILRGEYRVGYEFLLLAGGLALFLSGVYIKGHPAGFSATWLMAPGILLKSLFVLAVIRKSRRIHTTEKTD